VTVRLERYGVNGLFVLIIWSGWLLYTLPHSWQVIEDYWQVTLTMVFGSIVAGATSEGGGAIAFPVFTKLLHIAPLDAKVFSLAIQSVGMLAASMTIVMLRIQVLWWVIFWVSLGGFCGLTIGLLVAHLIAAEFIRMLFTMMAVSLALTLAFLDTGLQCNRVLMPVFSYKEVLILIGVGVVGGLISGLVGSGVDMLCFSVLVLLFRVNECVATPTSVILMAIHSIFGILIQVFVLEGINPQVQAYWLAAVPVVVVGAPLGALLCSRMPFYYIRYVLISLIMLELVSSLWILHFDRLLITFSLSMLLMFLVLMTWMSRHKAYIVS